MTSPGTPATPRATLREKLRDLEPRRFFADAFAEIEASRDAPTPSGAARRPIGALVCAAVCLTFIEYAGHGPALEQCLDVLDGDATGDATWLARIGAAGWFDLVSLAYWAAARVVGYFVLPVAFLVATGQRVRDQHLGTKGLGEHVHIYGVALVVVLALVTTVSFTEEFSTYYPFYAQAHRSVLDLVLWELVYFSQFFALEYFFRGFLLEQTRTALGRYAVFVAVVPYVMIHFGKPAAETAGALVAGIALGTLAMRTRSIWLGFAIHVSVALAMDVAALLQTNGLPRALLP